MLGLWCGTTLMSHKPIFPVWTDNTIPNQGHNTVTYSVEYHPNPTIKCVGSYTIFGYVCIANLTLEVWACVKVMSYGYEQQLPFWHFCWCRGFCHRTESDLFLFVFIKIKLNCEELYPVHGVRVHVYMCTLALVIWPWVKSWLVIGSWTTIFWKYYQYQINSKELLPMHGYGVCVHFDRGDTTSLGCEQQFFEVVSKEVWSALRLFVYCVSENHVSFFLCTEGSFSE